MARHAACSPSSANMWLACPASITKTAGMERPSSRYAREGTAAHTVAELNLKGDLFLPDKITVENEEFIVSPGMCRALNPYISYVQGLAKLPGAQAFFEQQLKVPQTYNMVWGTMDCGVVADYGGLFVTDLKFGKGHVVEPNAPQLKLYGLGFADLVGASDPRTPVTLAICQPRAGCEPLRTRTMLLSELWQFADFK